jgi:Protein of unknown function (DUF4236)
MPFRYRRSIKIAPGVRLNVGKQGINSVSVGRRGMTTNIGSKGTRMTLGIPGTGLSYYTRRVPFRKTAQSSPAPAVGVRVAVAVAIGVFVLLFLVFGN